MAYTRKAESRNPGCFLFLLDLSASMNDHWMSSHTKSQGLSLIINRILYNMILRNTEGRILKNRFDVGVIGYGHNDESIESVLGGALTGREIVSLSDLATNPVRFVKRDIEAVDGAGGIIKKTVEHPVWIEPTANHNTPMRKAILHSREILKEWIRVHPDAFPPIVINITDGEATDGDPTSAAKSLTSLSNNDGNVLLFNAHISSSSAFPVEYPDSNARLSDEYARMLFDMSSVFPETMIKLALTKGHHLPSGARGFVFNADMVSVINFIEIGTVTQVLNSTTTLDVRRQNNGD